MDNQYDSLVCSSSAVVVLNIQFGRTTSPYRISLYDVVVGNIPTLMRFQWFV